MKKLLALLLLFPLIIESKTAQEIFDEMPHMNEYFCQIDGMSFNLNWDENWRNYKSLITIDAFSDELTYGADDKLLGNVGLGEILFRQSNGGLKKYDFFFTDGASHEGNFIRGFYIDGVERADIGTLYVETFGTGDAMMTLTGSDEVRKGNCKFLKTYTKRLP
jgi:hypothetical protein